jgi:16S rRNA (uracil1498-N3)-methyltransferase
VNLFYQPGLAEGHLYLDADESRHCLKVLRKRPGDVIRITDGQGTFYDAVITGSDPNRCTFTIQSTETVPAKPYSIHVAVSPTKNADRIEWFVEKAVEIGIDTITLLDCENTERTYIKTDRLAKVAISAMKQSLKATLPTITPLTKLTDLINNVPANTTCFIAYVDFSNPLHLKDLAHPAQNYLVLIGPEGDFSPTELTLALSNNFQKVSLGPSRLRTETAALVALHTLSLINI